MPKKIDKPLPDLDPRLFWDVDYSPKTIINYPEFTVERVIYRGSVTDYKEIINYYGKARIKKLLKNNDRFSPETKSFIKIYFNLTDTDLCSLRPSFPKLWNY